MKILLIISITLTFIYFAFKYISDKFKTTIQTTKRKVIQKLSSKLPYESKEIEKRIGKWHLHFGKNCLKSKIRKTIPKEKFSIVRVVNGEFSEYFIIKKDKFNRIKYYSIHSSYLMARTKIRNSFKTPFESKDLRVIKISRK